MTQKHAMTAEEKKHFLLQMHQLLTPDADQPSMPWEEVETKLEHIFLHKEAEDVLAQLVDSADIKHKHGKATDATAIQLDGLHFGRVARLFYDLPASTNAARLFVRWADDLCRHLDAALTTMDDRPAKLTLFAAVLYLPQIEDIAYAPFVERFVFAFQGLSPTHQCSLVRHWANESVDWLVDRVQATQTLITIKCLNMEDNGELYTDKQIVALVHLLKLLHIVKDYGSLLDDMRCIKAHTSHAHHAAKLSYKTHHATPPSRLLGGKHTARRTPHHHRSSGDTPKTASKNVERTSSLNEGEAMDTTTASRATVEDEGEWTDCDDDDDTRNIMVDDPDAEDVQEMMMGEDGIMQVHAMEEALMMNDGDDDDDDDDSLSGDQSDGDFQAHMLQAVGAQGGDDPVDIGELVRQMMTGVARDNRSPFVRQSQWHEHVRRMLILDVHMEGVVMPAKFNKGGDNTASSSSSSSTSSPLPPLSVWLTNCAKMDDAMFINEEFVAKFDVNQDFVNHRRNSGKSCTSYLPAMQMIVDMNTRVTFISNKHSLALEEEQHKSMYHSHMVGGMHAYQMISGGHNLLIEVSRAHPVTDTIDNLRTIEQFCPASLKKPLRVKFRGEEGQDEGGVSKEFYQLITQELFNPDYGMFTFNSATGFYWFNSVNLDCVDEFRLIGLLFGIALYNNILVDVHFPSVLYRKLMGAPFTYHDLADYDPV